ncbi:MAG: primosomal protein N' [Pusillimonas sp.]|nr:primosomal protein N' [Pusillimonas sp.]
MAALPKKSNARGSKQEQRDSQDGATTYWLGVALDVPLGEGVFDYRSSKPVPLGARVIVTFGRRKMIGVVTHHFDEPRIDSAQVREVEEALEDIDPLPSDWQRMAQFAARYYQRPLGEVMLPSLPAPLRKVSAYQGKASRGGPVARMKKRRAPVSPAALAPDQIPTLNVEQVGAVEQVVASNSHQTFLLYGVTGSGKTEVYLHSALHYLAAGKQVLFMVPEINLTPQFEQVLRARLMHQGGEDVLAVLHSGLSDGQRLREWLRVSTGQARVLLGTRLSIFTPMPDLGLIIVDEEHDASYKQQDGLRYSARDLAVWRGHDRDIPVMLGSATPSLETWHHAQTHRYACLTLKQRAREVTLPDIRLVDTRRLELQQGFSPQLLEAMEKRLAAKEQVLIFLNRRGYAPALSCTSCGWVSQCPRCTAYTILHRSGPATRHHHLQCHHCGYHARVPEKCPDCGDADLRPMGRGTQRVEEYLGECFPGARIARIDADSTRLKGSAQALFAQVHAGEVDILVGTQMVAKGHDFARLGLVGVLNADATLFAQDFRAPERLFAQLMQVAGRAGRHVAGAQAIVQTDYPEQPVYQALLRHDYTGFARHTLQERESVGLPPFAFQALLTAEAKTIAKALAFLEEAKMLAQSDFPAYLDQGVVLYDPVPLRVVRVAHVERAQLLLESVSRPVLQAFLTAWNPLLGPLASQLRVRCTLEVDPLEI